MILLDGLLYTLTNTNSERYHAIFLRVTGSTLYYNNRSRFYVVCLRNILSHLQDC